MRPDPSVAKNEATPGSLAGRNIIVTGGATDIVRATSRLLSSLNALVLVCGRTESDTQDALVDMPGEVKSITSVASG